MPSIIIREIDETSAGTTAIVNDVAYVPGFSTNRTRVGDTDVKFVGEGSPSSFVPQLVFYNVDTGSFGGAKFKVVGKTSDESTIETDIVGEDGKYTYPLSKTVEGVTQYFSSVDSVTLENGESVLFLENPGDIPSTAELYTRFQDVGDYYYDKLGEELYVASNTPTSEYEIEVTMTVKEAEFSNRSVSLTSSPTFISSVDSVGGSETGFSFSNGTLTLTTDPSGDVTIVATIVADGKTEEYKFTNSVSSITSVKVNDNSDSNFTFANSTLTFQTVFWNVVEDTSNFVYVPENIPTYCATKAHFESLFGSYPYEFGSNQEYGNMFPEIAKPSSPMFRKGDFDPSYIYAKELICAGIPVYYDNVVKRDPMDGSLSVFKVSNIYDQMKIDFDALADPNEYNVKYITSGGYPTFEYGVSDSDEIGLGLVKQELKIATQGVVDDTGSTGNAGRGDIVALIDHTNNPQRKLFESGDQTSVFYVLGGVGAGGDVVLRPNSAVAKLQSADCDLSYGSMFTPWFKYTTKYTNGYKNGKDIGKFVIKMPASFAYLMDLASSIKTNPSWMAIAGVNRAQVVNYTGRTTAEVLTAKVAQNFQLRKDTTSINPITEIRPYGQCIWGNRTLKPHIDGLTATNFLNIRNLVCDVKKTVYRAAKRCMFEQDTQVLWINFKSQITPILDQMTTGQGISAYKVVRVPTTEKAKFMAKVILYPIYAIEDIEVTVVMRDEEVSVTSNEQ